MFESRFSERYLLATLEPYAGPVRIPRKLVRENSGVRLFTFRIVCFLGEHFVLVSN